MPALFLRAFEQTRESDEDSDENGEDKEEAEGEVELGGQDVHRGDGVFMFGAAAANEPEIPYRQGRG